MSEHEPPEDGPETKIRPVRFLTVSLYPESRPRRPFIRLCGHWLSGAGFTPKMKIRVEVAHGKIIITAPAKSDVAADS